MTVTVTNEPDTGQAGPNSGDSGERPAPVITVTRVEATTTVEMWVTIEHGRPVGWSRGDMLPDTMHVSYRDHHDGDGWDANAGLRGRRIRKDSSLGADDATAYLMTTGHLAQRQYSVEPDMEWVADWLAANRPTPYVQGDARENVLTALYEAAEDCGSSAEAEMTLSVLDELTEKAGLIWVCGECGWRNPAGRDECQCGQARPVPAAQPEGEADAG